MANINDIINSIDRAMWRLQDSQVNNVTPFTYRDGLTYLEVLERIRSSVVETIDYVGKFGEEQKKIIALMNEKVTTFITEMEKTHDAWNKDIEAKRKDTLDTIESFKSKLLEVALTRHRSDRYNLDNAFVGARTMDGKTQYMATINLTEKMEERINSINSKIDDQIASLPNTYYNKTYLDSEFQRADKRKHAIIVGSSNVVSGNSRWAEKVCEHFGYTAHNFGVGGGGFTSGVAARFDTQLNQAAADNSFKNSEVGLILIIDMLNDIRANYNVQDNAANCAQIISNNWPTAKVKMVPVIWNKSSLNIQASYMGQNISRSIQRVKKAMNSVNLAVCDGSVSWFWEANDYGENHVRGDDEVHLPDKSYIEAMHKTIAWMEGDSGWKNYGWRSLEDYGVEGWGPKKESMKNLLISREGTTVSIQGTFGASVAVPNDSYIWSIPSWAYPIEEKTLFAFDHDRNPCMFTVNYKGQLQTRQALKVGVGYFFTNTYRIW